MITHKILVQRVKRGVRLLDRKVPNWRRVMRRYQDRFNLNDANSCVLGILDNHSSQMRMLAKRMKVTGIPNFYRALRSLDLMAGFGESHGFSSSFDISGSESDSLQALWRAEFSKPPKPTRT